MKISIKTALITLAVMCFVYFAEAQDMRRILDLNGYLFRGVQTKDSIVLYFGTPDKYRSMMSEIGLDEEFSYGKSIIRLGENGNAYAFGIFDKRFAVYTFATKGGIIVGDSVSKIRQLGFGELKFVSSDLFYFWNIGDFPLKVYHKSGIITSLHFEVSSF
jgi:hypothetical protein